MKRHHFQREPQMVHTKRWQETGGQETITRLIALFQWKSLCRRFTRFADSRFCSGHHRCRPLEEPWAYPRPGDETFAAPEAGDTRTVETLEDAPRRVHNRAASSPIGPGGGSS